MSQRTASSDAVDNETIRAYITNDSSKRKRQLIKDIYFWRMHIMNGNEYLNYILVGLTFA